MTAFPSRRTLGGQPLLLSVAVAVLLLVVGITVAFARGVGGPDSVDSTVTDAPGFSLTAFDGSEFSLEDHANQPVLLYFWASWCEPCKTEAPLIEKLWAEYKDKGYVFVGMNIWDSETEAQDFAKRYGLTFPVVRDRENAVYLDYGVDNLPLALFLRPGLEVSRRSLGQLKESDLRSMLDALVVAP